MFSQPKNGLSKGKSAFTSAKPTYYTKTIVLHTTSAWLFPQQRKYIYIYIYTQSNTYVNPIKKIPVAHAQDKYGGDTQRTFH